MHEVLIIIGAVLTCIISYFTINKLVFYTKSEVDTKLDGVKKEFDIEDNQIQRRLEQAESGAKNDLHNIKEKIYEKLSDVERENNKMIREIYDRLSQNKQVFDEYNKNMMEAISQLKQGEKENITNMVQMLNAVKDDLKTDYINRYNDLLTLIGAKANSTDFDRLENKFDKVCETTTELKAILQIQMEKEKKQKQQ